MDLYKAFLDYATSGVEYNSEIDTLERFFFIVVWGIGAKDMPKHKIGRASCRERVCLYV